ncbi:head-tail connector protein [Sphingomonas olei]|uniref:Phage gp6-like head-tail connector protein n=1 Tax=Sphingomonas olei TaxID=1886787 RepID=A0ABY2QL48_9SPHN|nr:head-tail connector protein [Sphingomonas olei]THG40437.1 phage gp6-like head-tail connector protein [Sphingomonas olei]
MAGASANDGIVLTITDARHQLRVSGSVDDATIAPLILAAEGRIESFLGRELVGPTGWATAADVPALVVQCVRYALTDFYLNREAPELTDEQLLPIIGRHMVITFA